MPTWDDVVTIGRALPEVEESTWFGTPSLKVKGKGFVRLRGEAEGGLVLMCRLDEKQALLASGDPAFYTTPHYDGYGAILVDLDRVSRDQLAELVEAAWWEKAPPRVRKAFEASMTPTPHGHGHSHGAGPGEPPVMDEGFWDERYGQADAIWSGNPNPQLVDETSELPAGTALDVGCGEGADAIWLAGRGWHVTGVDISQAVLDRAAKHAEAAGVADRITWLHADLTGGTSPGAGFDLVSAHFMHLPVAQRVPLYRRLAAAVSPGGTFLVVGHHPSDTAMGRPNMPGMYFTAAEVAADLDPVDWTVLVEDERERTAVDPDGRTVTVRDAVLKARRNVAAQGIPVSS